MVKAKCIGIRVDRNRNSNIDKRYYRLEDDYGNVKDIESNMLKLAIIQGKIEVDGLKFIRNGNLRRESGYTAKREYTHEIITEEACVSEGIPYKKAAVYHYWHPELTCDDVIAYFSNKEQRLSEKCDIAGVDFGKVYSYVYKHPEMDVNKVIESYMQKESKKPGMKNVDIARIVGVDPRTVSRLKRNFPDITDEECIERLKDNKLSVSDKCALLGLKFNTVNMYIYWNRELAVDEVILECLKRKEQREGKEVPFKYKWKAFNLNKENLYLYRKKHPELTDTQIIEVFIKKRLGKKNEDEISLYQGWIPKRNENIEKLNWLKRKCNRMKLDYDKVYKYVNKHPQYTCNEILEFFRLKNMPTTKDNSEAMKKFHELSKMAKKLNLSINDIMDYKEFNSSLSNEDLIKLYLMNNKRMAYNEATTIIKYMLDLV